MRIVLRGQQRSGQKHNCFYPKQGSAQQQAANRYGQVKESIQQTDTRTNKELL